MCGIFKYGLIKRREREGENNAARDLISVRCVQTSIIPESPETIMNCDWDRAKNNVLLWNWSTYQIIDKFSQNLKKAARNLTGFSKKLCNNIDEIFPLFVLNNFMQLLPQLLSNSSKLAYKNYIVIYYSLLIKRSFTKWDSSTLAVADCVLLSWINWLLQQQIKAFASGTPD